MLHIHYEWHFQVVDCLDVDSDTPVKHSNESILLPEKYEIVWTEKRLSRAFEWNRWKWKVPPLSMFLKEIYTILIFEFSWKFDLWLFLINIYI